MDDKHKYEVEKLKLSCIWVPSPSKPLDTDTFYPTLSASLTLPTYMHI